MSDAPRSSFGLPHPPDVDLALRGEDCASCPTPSGVLGQIARVIAVCLGLGLLARVLVSFVGMH